MASSATLSGAGRPRQRFTDHEDAALHFHSSSRQRPGLTPTLLLEWDRSSLMGAAKAAAVVPAVSPRRLRQSFANIHPMIHRTLPSHCSRTHESRYVSEQRSVQTGGSQLPKQAALPPAAQTTAQEAHGTADCSPLAAPPPRPAAVQRHLPTASLSGAVWSGLRHWHVTPEKKGDPERSREQALGKTKEKTEQQEISPCPASHMSPKATVARHRGEAGATGPVGYDSWRPFCRPAEHMGTGRPSHSETHGHSAGVDIGSTHRHPRRSDSSDMAVATACWSSCSDVQASKSTQQAPPSAMTFSCALASAEALAPSCLSRTLIRPRPLAAR